MTESSFDLAGRRVWIAGHRGMVGSALMRRLADEPCELLTITSKELDLRRQDAVEAWMQANRPDVVFMAAARVGGILANNDRPAEFLYDNLAIETNIIHAAHLSGVAKLVFLGSTCIYPREAPQPMPESALLTGPLEPTNQWYAIAKIAGLMMCRAYRRQYGSDFIAAQPTNLYGSEDNFDLAGSHVLPALLRKVHEAKAATTEAVEIWGTGTPKREFLHVDDLADALVFLCTHYSEEEHVNIGTGAEVSIRELADTIASVVGYDGKFVYDSDKPDGMPRKLGDVSRLKDLGWSARIDLRAGLEKTYRWYLDTATKNGVGAAPTA